MSTAEHSLPTLGPLGTTKPPQGHRPVRIAIGSIGVAAGVLALGVVLLSVRASRDVNRVPLAADPRPVTVVAARSAPYRGTRTYVGAVEPWVEASVGPQYISAYVDDRARAAGRHRQARAGPRDARLLQPERGDARRRDAGARGRRARARGGGRGGALLDDARRRLRRAERRRAEERGEPGRSGPAPRDEGERPQDVARRARLRPARPVRRRDRDAQLRPGRVRPPRRRHRLGRRPRHDAGDGRRLREGLRRARPLHHGPDRHPRDGQLTCRRRSRAARPGPTPGRARSTSRSTCPTRSGSTPWGRPRSSTSEVGEPVPATEVPIYAATQDEGKAKLFVVDHDVAHAQDPAP